jgi:iron complex outermembrane recepter protein
MYGAEFEGQWQISSNDRLSGFLNYLHATYTNYINAVDQQFGTLYPSLDGKYLPFSPQFSGRLQYSHEMPLQNNGSLIATGTVYWQTVSYLREFNLPVDTVPADLELQYLFPGRRYSVSGFVHNLEDNAVRNGSFAYGGSYLSSYSPPRTFGVRFSFKN